MWALARSSMYFLVNCLEYSSAMVSVTGAMASWHLPYMDRALRSESLSRQSFMALRVWM